ncbi:MAG TPA: hypothetical protein VFN18_00315 [Solirubrobacterales bacterium]|nr:hypothetical protein [Solirubrobacterales bacterium]
MAEKKPKEESMSKDSGRQAAGGSHLEERAVLADAAVGFVSSGAGAAVGMVVGHRLTKPSDPPPPPPPKIELPPGVDRD